MDATTLKFFNDTIAYCLHPPKGVRAMLTMDGLGATLCGGFLFWGYVKVPARPSSVESVRLLRKGGAAVRFAGVPGEVEVHLYKMQEIKPVRNRLDPLREIEVVDVSERAELLHGLTSGPDSVDGVFGHDDKLVFSPRKEARAHLAWLLYAEAKECLGRSLALLMDGTTIYPPNNEGCSRECFDMRLEKALAEAPGWFPHDLWMPAHRAILDRLGADAVFEAVRDLRKGQEDIAFARVASMVWGDPAGELLRIFEGALEDGTLAGHRPTASEFHPGIPWAMEMAVWEGGDGIHVANTWNRGTVDASQVLGKTREDARAEVAELLGAWKPR